MKIHYLIYTAITCLWLVCGDALMGQEQQPNNPLPSDSSVLVGHLPNGFTYYIKQNKEPENRALSLFLSLI